MADVIDFKQKAKQAAKKLEDDNTGRDDFFNDGDVVDIFMTMLLFMRDLSISQTVILRIADDQLIVEAKNHFVHDESETIESGDCLTKIGSMYLTDEDDDLLPDDELIEGFQEILRVIQIEDAEEADVVDLDVDDEEQDDQE